METSTLEPIRPSRAVADALIALIKKDVVERLRLGTALWDGTEEDTWWKDYHDKLAEYEAGGALSLNGGILSLHRGSRSSTGDSSFGGLRPEVFDVLDSTDIDSCTISLGATYSSASSIEVEFTPYACILRYDVDTFETRLAPPMPIEDVEAVLRASGKAWEPPVTDMSMARPFRVFIGHGGDHQWRTLKDALRDNFSFEIESFERETRTANVISEILPAMGAASSAAVLVLTKADEMADGKWRGRQNVVHEIGYMQGVLGWGRTIIVVEEGVELFSNLDGTQHIPFPEGRIGAATGDVVAALNNLKARPYGVCM